MINKSINYGWYSILGPPGACKNEIAQLVAVKYGFFYISMGESLRQKVSKNQDDELWKKIGEKMNIGDPIPMVNWIFW